MFGKNFIGSSCIEQAYYDNVRHNLYILFTSGAEYKYDDVPKAVYDDLRESDSAGKYFHRNIRNNYKFSKSE